MRVSFTPALGQTTVVPVPQDESEAHLLFNAAFASEEELVRAKQQGIRVEVWSDIPVQGRALGEWGALPFNDLPSDNGHSSRGGPETFKFSLVPRSAYPSRAAGLHLKISARLPAGHCRFSYTYRLVYPSGEIKWLGEYGCNGCLAVERRDPRLDLRGGWKMENKGLHVWQADNETSADDVEVAELTRDVDWLCWSVGGEGRILPHDLGSGSVRSSMILLTPRARPDAVICPSSLALCSSPGSSVSISSKGVINYCSPHPGFLRMWTLAEPQNCMDHVLAACTGLVRLVHLDPTSGQAILASAESAQPLLVSIIPLSPITAPFEVVLPIYTLGNLLPQGDHTQICLFSHESGVARTLLITSEELSEKNAITFVVDNKSGGQFVVAPVNVKISSDVQEEQAWEIAIVTPYSPIHNPPEPVHRLPTPPPSPPIPRTDKVASVPPAAPVHVKRVSFHEPVHLVIPASPSEESTISDEEYRVMPVPWTITRLSTQPPVQSLYRRYLAVILQAGFWFVRNVIWLVFGFMRIFSIRSRSNQSRIEEVSKQNSHEPEGTDVEQSSTDDTKAEEDYQDSELSSSAVSPAESEAKIFSPQPSSEHIIALDNPASEGGPAHSRLATLLSVDVPGGNTKFLVRPNFAAATAHQLHTELNGKRVQPDFETVNGDSDLFLATVDGGEFGGRLVVSVPLGH